MDRESSLALLRNNHVFPGPFDFRVVMRPEAIGSTVSAMAATGSAADVVESVRRRESRNGNYVSLRVRMHLTDAERVLDVYEVLNSLDGILTAM